MKILFYTLLLPCFLQNAFGQVSGKLTAPDGQPIPFANVLLLNLSDSSFIKGTITDEWGEYAMDRINAGKYFLQYSAIGFLTYNSSAFELTVSQKMKSFGTQIMNEDTQQLNEVVIQADKPLYQQEIDRTVINVESSVLTKGSSALEVLERSPGVVIDHRNNSIALSGKSGVMVMLDGKVMRLPEAQVVTLLNGMSADDIEKIELMTTPPSKYDAEGSAGMINIVLKKNKKQGTNGAVSITGGYGWGEKGTGSFNLAHNTNKINLNGSYTFSHDRTYSDMFITSAQNMPALGGAMEVLFWDTTKLVKNNHDASLGLDLKLNPTTTIGSSITYHSSAASSLIINQADFNILPDSLLLFKGEIHSSSHWNNLISTVYVEKEFREGEKINIDVDYLHFKNDNPSEVQNFFTNTNGIEVGTNSSLFSPRQKGFANTTIQVSVVKMDYTKQLGKNVKLETGVKGAYTKSSSLSGIESLVNGEWVNRTETYDEMGMQEGIGAVYAAINAQLNSPTNLIIGARYEYSNTSMDNPETGENVIDRKLGVLFPSLFFSKKLNENADLQLSYTKRISRPSYIDLASFIAYSDPTAVYTGNPLLKPTITNNIKLGYNYRGYTFSLFFSRDENPIARYQITQSPQANLLYVSPQNLPWQNNITFQANLPWKVNDWWNMNYGLVGGLRQFKVDHTLQTAIKTYFGYSFNFNQSFSLPNNFLAEFSGWYNATSYNGSIKVGGFGALNAGIKKELKNNRGSFQVSVSDLLRNMHINVYYGTFTKEAFSIKNHVSINTESRVFPIIKLTYSRSFGNSSMKDQKHDIGSKDERDRIREN